MLVLLFMRGITGVFVHAGSNFVTKVMVGILQRRFVKFYN